MQLIKNYLYFRDDWEKTNHSFKAWKTWNNCRKNSGTMRYAVLFTLIYRSFIYLFILDLRFCLKKFEMRSTKREWFRKNSIITRIMKSNKWKNLIYFKLNGFAQNTTVWHIFCANNSKILLIEVIVNWMNRFDDWIESSEYNAFGHIVGVYALKCFLCTLYWILFTQ